MKRLIVGFLFGVTLAGGIATATPERDHVVVRIPVCAEDEPYLEGRGDFDGLRWDRYRCRHFEDF